MLYLHITDISMDEGASYGWGLSTDSLSDHWRYGIVMQKILIDLSIFFNTLKDFN